MIDAGRPLPSRPRATPEPGPRLDDATVAGDGRRPDGVDDGAAGRCVADLVAVPTDDDELAALERAVARHPAAGRRPPAG